MVKRKRRKREGLDLVQTGLSAKVFCAFHGRVVRVKDVYREFYKATNSEKSGRISAEKNKLQELGYIESWGKRKGFTATLKPFFDYCALNKIMFTEQQKLTIRHRLFEEIEDIQQDVFGLTSEELQGGVAFRPFLRKVEDFLKSVLLRSVLKDVGEFSTDEELFVVLGGGWDETDRFKPANLLQYEKLDDMDKFIAYVANEFKSDLRDQLAGIETNPKAHEQSLIYKFALLYFNRGLARTLCVNVTKELQLEDKYRAERDKKYHEKVGGKYKNPKVVEAAEIIGDLTRLRGYKRRV